MPPQRLERIPAKYRKEVEQQLKKLSRLIQGRREELELTQEQLAERLDISVMTLQFIEQGRRYPSLPMLLYVLKRLNVDMHLERTETRGSRISSNDK